MTADIDIEEAIRGTEAQDWKQTITEEVQSHLEHGTWEMADRPEENRVIGSKVILKN